MYLSDFDEWEPRTTLAIPPALLPAPPSGGCVVKVQLRGGRVVKGLAVERTSMRWHRFLLGTRGYKVI
jgi:hypothetical protein